MVYPTYKYQIVDRRLLHNVIKLLTKVADRYAPSRMLSFDIAHVFKTLQLIQREGLASRALLTDELNLGEGSVKTLVKHLKMQGLVETSNAGMWMTEKGNKIFTKLNQSIPKEMDVPMCSIVVGKFNHAVLIKDIESEIGSGVEQRDAAIRMGALGATTLLFRERKFFMPGRNQDSLRTDPEIRELLLSKLNPDNGDAIIIGSAENKKVAELATINTALLTVSAHHKHY